MSLPQLPSLQDLGLPVTRKPSRKPTYSSDGQKRVNYNSYQPQNVRPFQTPQRAQPKRSGGPTPKRAQPKSAPRKVWAPKKIYPNLKIVPYGEFIAKTISEHPIIAIDFPTGTGKTRYIPYLMASKGHQVRVAIPITVAVRDAYNFQKKHTNLTVGYAAGREIKYNTTDQLVYATTGHFTQKILSYIKTNRRDLISKLLGDIFFIDEVHTSTSQITLLIGLIRHLFLDESGNYTGPKLVFATATFNHGDIKDHFPEFPVIRSRESDFAYPITEIFLETPRNPVQDDPDFEIERIVREEIQRWTNSPQKYHGIIFRPGVYEVEKTISFLETRFDIDAPVDFYPAYGGLSKDELDRIFEPSERMKIIVGTNIIESGVTIDDAGFVIDDMLEKVAETGSTGGQKLTLSVISQAASQQRKGRTGRTIEGRDYKLITENDFQALPQFRQREIDRIPIFDIVLQLMDAGLNPMDVLKVSLFRYDQARRILSEFGMIQAQGDVYRVTEIGEFVSSIPMSIHNAYMIYLGYQRYLEFLREGHPDLSGEKVVFRSVIAVAAMLEAYGPSYMFVPRKKREESHSEYAAAKDAHIEKYHEKFRGATDVHTFVNIFWEMMSDMNISQQYDKSSRNKFYNYIRTWSNDNSMNHKKIKEFLLVLRDIESIVEAILKKGADLESALPVNAQNLSLSLPDGGFHDLGTIVAELFSRAYVSNRFYRGVSQRGQIHYLDRDTQIRYKVNRNSSFNSIKITNTSGPGEIIAAQTIEVVKGTMKIYLAGIIISSEYFSPDIQEAPEEPPQEPVKFEFPSFPAPSSEIPKFEFPSFETPKFTFGAPSTESTPFTFGSSQGTSVPHLTFGSSQESSLPPLTFGSAQESSLPPLTFGSSQETTLPSFTFGSSQGNLPTSSE